MNLDEEDLRELYDDIERAILAGSTATAQKKIKHDYMLGHLDPTVFEQLYYICAARIREDIEKVFLKHIDKDLMQKVKLDSEKRRRPRKKVEVKKEDKVVGKAKVGGLNVVSYG